MCGQVGTAAVSRTPVWGRHDTLTLLAALVGVIAVLVGFVVLVLY